MSFWKSPHTLLGFVVVIALLGGAIIFSTIYTRNQPDNLTVWAINAVLLIAFVLVLGHGMTGRWSGILIDERNKMSLSRLQLVIWTILILSAFITAVEWNVLKSYANPLNIAIPSDIWFLLGISATSFIGQPLILNGKTSRPDDPAQTNSNLDTLARQRGITLNPSPAAVTAPPSHDASLPPAPGWQANPAAPSQVFDSVQPPGTLPTNPPTQQATTDPSLADKLDQLNIVMKGQLVTYASDNDAQFADMFKGEESGNMAQLDLSKIQMFYFTIVVAVSYLMALSAMLSGNPGGGLVSAFPDVSQGMVVLLGISHAGYLSYKAAPHSDTSPIQSGQ